MQAIKRYELIELSIPASTIGRVNFETYPQLQNQNDQLIYILDIDVFTVATYSNSQKTNTIGGLPVTDIPKAVLILYVDGQESIHFIPIAKLINIEDFSNPSQQWIQSFDRLMNVDFSKSAVQFSVASDATPYIMPFGVNYIRYQKQPGGVTANQTPPGNFVER